MGPFRVYGIINTAVGLSRMNFDQCNVCLYRREFADTFRYLITMQGIIN